MSQMSAMEDSAVWQIQPSVRFLLVEDSTMDAASVQIHLDQALDIPFDIEHVETLAEAIHCLDRQRYDLVLLDLILPDSSGLDTFHRVLQHAAEDAILILSGHEDGEAAVEAVRAGAEDYIFKGHLSAPLLARGIRLAVERSRRIQAERALTSAREQIRIARRLQRSLYPQSAPNIPGFDMAGRAWSAEHACGDYFDFVPMQNHAMGLVVGDVSGHGLGPALKMVETRATLHALSKYESNLCRLLGEIHRVFQCGRNFESDAFLFLSLFLARLNPDRRTLEYVSAGHPGFHMTAGGTVRRIQPTDVPIGVAEAMSSTAAGRIVLKPGDLVIIPTDGLFEAKGKHVELMGLTRLLDVVREHRHKSAETIVAEMYSAARNYVSGLRQEDDMAAIVLKACP